MNFLLLSHDLLADSSSAAYRAGQVLGAILGLVIVIAVPVMFVVSLVRYLVTRRGGWLVGLVITSLLLLAGGALVAVGAWKGYQNGSTRAKTTEIITSSDGIVQFSIPSNWKNLTQLPEQGTIRKGNLSREEYLLVLAESKADFTGTLEDAAIAGIAVIKGTLTDVKCSEPTFLTIGRRQAVQYEISGVINQYRIVYLATFVDAPGSLQKILMWTMESKRDAALPIFKTVLESTKIKDLSVTEEEP